MKSFAGSGGGGEPCLLLSCYVCTYLNVKRTIVFWSKSLHKGICHTSSETASYIADIAAYVSTVLIHWACLLSTGETQKENDRVCVIWGSRNHNYSLQYPLLALWECALGWQLCSQISRIKVLENTAWGSGMMNQARQSCTKLRRWSWVLHQQPTAYVSTTRRNSTSRSVLTQWRADHDNTKVSQWPNITSNFPNAILVQIPAYQ